MRYFYRMLRAVDPTFDGRHHRLVFAWDTDAHVPKLSDPIYMSAAARTSTEAISGCAERAWQVVFTRAWFVEAGDERRPEQLTGNDLLKKTFLHEALHNIDIRPGWHVVKPPHRAAFYATHQLIVQRAYDAGFFSRHVDFNVEMAKSVAGVALREPERVAGLPTGDDCSFGAEEVGYELGSVAFHWFDHMSPKAILNYLDGLRPGELPDGLRPGTSIRHPVTGQEWHFHFAIRGETDWLHLTHRQSGKPASIPPSWLDMATANG